VNRASVSYTEPVPCGLSTASDKYTPGCLPPAIPLDGRGFGRGEIAALGAMLPIRTSPPDPIGARIRIETVGHAVFVPPLPPGEGRGEGSPAARACPMSSTFTLSERARKPHLGAYPDTRTSSPSSPHMVGPRAHPPPFYESVYNNMLGGRLSLQVMVVKRSICRVMARPSRYIKPHAV
jgi:hypothetical protein